MARPSTAHRCRSCRAMARRWAGRCPSCGEWNTLEAVPAGARHPGGGPGASCPGGHGEAAVPLASVDVASGRPRTTGIAEVDRVLAGGLLAGSVTLVFGEPGVGKSTLLLQAASAVAGSGRRVLLVSAEESPAQVRARAARLGPVPPDLFVTASPEIGSVEEAVPAVLPELVVVDSIQALVDPEVGGTPGTVSQVRACTDRLVRLAKPGGPAVVVVGHVTKEGGLAGPRSLEHLVDTVLSFEGDRHHALRLLRAVKHRFGATGEVGLFEMHDGGLRPVADPGPLLLGDRRADVPGSAVTVLLEGRRPLVVEIQALACAAAGPVRRTVQGIDPRRLASVLAVLQCRAGTATGSLTLFASATGGVRAVEPAVDLPLALAVASAVTGRALPADLVSVGEVGLAGEIRQVAGTERRLAEAARLGFTRALVPASAPPGPAGLTALRVATVADALAAAFRLRDRDGPGRPALPGGTMPPWSTTPAIR